MILDVLMWMLRIIIDLLVQILGFLSQGLSIWPQTVLDGLTYFFISLMNIDFLLNITALLQAIKFLVAFEIVYVGAKLVIKLVNWVRGSGEIEI